MKTWNNIKKLNKQEQEHYTFRSVKCESINKFKDYWIDILHDKVNKKYTVSFFGSMINRCFESYYSCRRLIHELAVEYMQYNKSFIDDFLKSKDLL